ncbi:MAG: methyltransferase domain-containing protein, partial [Sciscionella sp.]
WAEQLTKDGTILVDVQLGTGAGNLVLLHRDRDSLTGRFLTRRGTFMPMRRPNTTTNTNPPPELDGPLRTSTTQTPPQIWVDAPLAWYLAQLGLPAGVGYGYLLDRERRTPRAVTVTAPDGSRAQVSLTADPHTGRHDLIEQGPTPLWPTISEAFTRWVELGEPSWERLGLTVTATEQTLWLDNATSSNTWRLANCA